MCLKCDLSHSAPRTSTNCRRSSYTDPKFVYDVTKAVSCTRGRLQSQTPPKTLGACASLLTYRTHHTCAYGVQEHPLHTDSTHVHTGPHTHTHLHSITYVRTHHTHTVHSMYVHVFTETHFTHLNSHTPRTGETVDGSREQGHRPDQRTGESTVATGREGLGPRSTRRQDPGTVAGSRPVNPDDPGWTDPKEKGPGLRGDLDGSCSQDTTPTRPRPLFLGPPSRTVTLRSVSSHRGGDLARGGERTGLYDDV